MHVIYTICAMPFSYLYNGKNNKKYSPVSIFRVIAENLGDDVTKMTITQKIKNWKNCRSIMYRKLESLYIEFW